MAVQTRVGMPMEEFIREFDHAPFELIDSKRIPVLPSVAGIGMSRKQIYMALVSYEQTDQIINAFPHFPYVLTDSFDWISGVRLPDIMIYRTERIAAYRAQTPDFADKPIILVPDLCIEIISQNDNYQDVEAKVDNYLSDGVKLIWVVNPRNKTVAVYSQGSDLITRLNVEATLSGGDVLPNFALPLKAIFPEQP